MNSVSITIRGSLFLIEEKTSKNGTTYTSIVLKVSTPNKDENGHYICEFWNCRAFGSTVDTIAKMGLNKGDCCAITGRPSFSVYKSKDGSPKISKDVIIESIEAGSWKDIVGGGDKPAKPKKPASNKGFDEMPW